MGYCPNHLQEAPQTSWIRFGSGGWATISAEPGHVPGRVASDVLPFL